MGLSKAVVPHARGHPGLSPFGKLEPTIWYQAKLFSLTKMGMKTGWACGASWGGVGEKELFVPPALSGRETSQESVPRSPGPLPRRDPPSAPARGFLPSPTTPLLHPTTPRARPAPFATGFQGRLARHGHGHSATRSCGAHGVERAGSRVWVGD